jgi:hypothetical protein
MLLFRSEEHVDRWREERDMPRGGTLSLDQLWGLASIWYRDRLEPDWRRRTAEEAQAVFEGLGLSGEFWRLSA